MSRWMPRLAALLVAVAAAPAALATTTGFKFVSTPGDYVGQGKTMEFDAPAATVVGHTTVWGTEVTVGQGSEVWFIDFAPTIISALGPGSYPAAGPYPTQSPMRPGLSVSGESRGCGPLLGWFRIKEYVVNPLGTVKRLSIDFMQRCNATDPPMYGALRLNSNLPLVVPTLASVAGPDFDALSGQVTALDGSQSFTRHRGALSYRWTQVSGPAVTLNDPTAMSPTFVAPAVGPEGAALDFRLVVTDSTGDTDTDDVIVVVNAPTTPRTGLSFHGDPGDYITGGQARHYDLYDAAFYVWQNAGGGVSTRVLGDTDWMLETAAPKGQPFKPGNYRYAQRYPFQPATAPGLSFDGNGNGCNTLTGSFKVFAVKFDTQGNPTTADITWEQHCEGVKAASYGELLLNAVPHATLQAQLRQARAQAPRR